MSLYLNPSEEGFELAYDLATKKLIGMNPEELCRRTGAHLLDPKRITLTYLNRSYLIDISKGEIRLKDEEENIPIKDRILILHYLTQAKGTPFTQKLITYAQLQGGKFYCPAFQQRTLQPILRYFGGNPEWLLEIAKRLGGEQASYGDLSVKIEPLPFIRIVIVLWRGDEEVPPGGNILFDKNIKDYLTTEDVAVLTETLTWRLIRLAQTSPF
ncbi:MAG: DUF3786 domain-containing protein [Thermodesulfobacteriota bacterium]